MDAVVQSHAYEAEFEFAGESSQLRLVAGVTATASDIEGLHMSFQNLRHANPRTDMQGASSSPAMSRANIINGLLADQSDGPLRVYYY